MKKAELIDENRRLSEELEDITKSYQDAVKLTEELTEKYKNAASELESTKGVFHDEYRKLKNENTSLRVKLEGQQGLIEALQEKIEALQKGQKHNARGAGRTKHDDKWAEGYNQFEEMYASQKSKSEIIETLKISNATYYRYKKHYDEEHQ